MSHQAVVYDSQLSEPLLVHTTSHGEAEPRHDVPRGAMQQQEQQKLVRLVQLSSIVIGLFIGILIQLSTLGVNSIFVKRFGDQYLFNSKLDTFIFSYLYSMFMSSIAISFVLSAIRGYVSGIDEVAASLSTRTPPASQEEEGEDTIDDIKSAVDCFFAVGTMLGACGLYFALEAVFGLGLMQGVHVMYFMSSLFIVLAIFRATEQCGSSSSNKKNANWETTDQVVVEDLLIV